MLAVAKGNIKRGAGWFDVIAGLSVVNAIPAMMGSWVFLAGLGITTVANQVGASFGTSGRAIGFIITLVAAGVFVMLGHFAKQGQTWALILGIVFYALDTVLVLIFMTQAWLIIPFPPYHLFLIPTPFFSLKLYKHLTSH